MVDIDKIEELIDRFYEELPCQSDIPFPEVKVESKNLAYAELLLDAQSSAADSEIQAVVQYLYHHKTINNSHISAALECIALIEMKHYEVLEDLIRQLGGKPVQYNSNKAYWNTENISYGDRDILSLKYDDEDAKERHIVRKKLMLDIKGEINAINGYKFIKNNISDKYIRRVIDKIISDEEAHIEVFEALIRKYT